ncbi:amidohydrolase family protein [Stigmatella sp. ncwal1]|uniref:Amidohydrolase family protein n=1 Tax=Stigmatella ashevillensis TaxID=2995309 RepID=A0ABT5DG92_9BACT|nr:amidohydrolase family protein [Stigmatella ashevillena]MDC0711376.1 amidohydrolase family protein [Stigmatella ashevillena]
MTKACVWVGLLLLWGVPTSEAATERSSVVILGKVAGHQQVEYLPEGRVKVHFEYNDRGRGPSLDTVYQVGANGTVTSAESQGVDYLKAAVQERYTAQGTSHAWKNSAEDEQRQVSGPAFYLGLHAPPEETVLLVRAALRAPGQRLVLLPSGEVQVTAVGTHTLKGKSRSLKVRLYALSGIDLEPSYVWLDEDQRFFAGGSSWSMTLREGFENTQELLIQHQEAEQGRLAQARAKQLTTKLDRPLAITHARVFDPGTLAVEEDQTVLVAQGRITAVGPSAKLPVPPGARTLDAQGRFLMPGLWDMHAHISRGPDGPIAIAAGVTTVRDLANDEKALTGFITDIEAGRDIGPRVIKAGFMDGRSPYSGPTKVFVDDEAEARAAIDHYAAHGFEQIKVYSSIKPELVPVIASLAHAKGLRVSGHVPAFMTARQFIEAGADEIQHINFLALNFLFDKVQDTRTPARFIAVGENAAALELSSPAVRDFITLLRDRKVVVDPTVSIFDDMFHNQPGHWHEGASALLNRVPPTWQRWMRSGSGGLPDVPKRPELYRDSFLRLVEFVGLLHRSGVRIVAGTDNVSGLVLPRELELYVAAGIPPKEVLRIATLGNAEVMKRDKEFGRVLPGYTADLILIEGDPTLLMSDVRKVRHVIRGDRLYESAAVFRSVGIVP